MEQARELVKYLFFDSGRMGREIRRACAFESRLLPCCIQHCAVSRLYRVAFHGRQRAGGFLLIYGDRDVSTA